MNKWILLGLITVFFLLLDYFFHAALGLHHYFVSIVIFFAVQTYLLFRLDHWVPEKWAAELSLAKIVLRFLSTLFFVAILISYRQDMFRLVIQFMILYLVYMIFEIGTSLANLRRN